MMTATALCLLLRSLFLAEDREGSRRAGRFHDDRGARRARFATIADFPEASSAAAGDAVFAGAEAEAEKAGLAKLGHVGARRHGEDQGERLPPTEGSIVLALLSGEFAIKRYRRRARGFGCRPRTQLSASILLNDKTVFEV